VKVLASFVILGNWTDQGIRYVKAAPERIHPMRSMVEKVNGKMQLYYTLGTYDFVMIIEVPTDEDIIEILSSLGSMGNVRTATMKAWTESEVATMLKSSHQ
jgi:uncharacterized protein with GYD domain